MSFTAGVEMFHFYCKGTDSGFSSPVRLTKDNNEKRSAQSLLPWTERFVNSNML